MLMTLTVHEEKPRSLRQRLRARFCPVEIKATKHKQFRVSVQQVDVTLRRGRLYGKQLYPYTIGCCKTVLCDETTDLNGTTLRRFQDTDFACRMMRNYLEKTLKRLSDQVTGLRIGYYDPMAEHPDIAESLLAHTPMLRVVSDMPRFYESEAERLLCEHGAALTVSQSTEILSDCHLVVCSTAPVVALPLPDSTLVAAPSKPLVSFRNITVHDYCVEMPFKYARLKPDGMEDLYFLSALYTLGGCRELAELVPFAAKDGCALYTTERLKGRLEIICKENP